MRLYDPRLTFVAVAGLIALGFALALVTTPHLMDLSCAPAPGPVLHCHAKAENLFGLPSQLRSDVTADPWRAGLLPLIEPPSAKSFQDLEWRFDYQRRGMTTDSQLVLRFGYGHWVPVTPSLPMGDTDFDALGQFMAHLRAGETAQTRYRSGWAGWYPLLYVIVLTSGLSFGTSGRARIRVDPDARVLEVERRRRWLAKPELRTLALDEVASVTAHVVDERTKKSPWQVRLVPRDGEPIPVAMPVDPARARRWAKTIRELLDLEGAEA